MSREPVYKYTQARMTEILKETKERARKDLLDELLDVLEIRKLIEKAIDEHEYNYKHERHHD